MVSREFFPVSTNVYRPSKLPTLSYKNSRPIFFSLTRQLRYLTRLWWTFFIWFHESSFLYLLMFFDPQNSRSFHIKNIDIFSPSRDKYGIQHVSGQPSINGFMWVLFHIHKCLSTLKTRRLNSFSFLSRENYSIQHVSGGVSINDGAWVRSRRR